MMRIRSVLVCTIWGAIVLLGFQVASQATIPWRQLALRQPAVVTPAAAAKKTTAIVVPVASTHFNTYGVFVSSLMTADTRDRDPMIRPMLARQLALNGLVVFLMCLLVGRLNTRNPLAAGAGAAVAGLAAAAVLAVSMNGSFDFPPLYLLANVLDTTFGFFFTGTVIGGLALRVERISTAPAKASRKATAPVDRNTPIRQAAVAPDRERKTPVDLPIIADYSGEPA
jgi:hypothetical protein